MAGRPIPSYEDNMPNASAIVWNAVTGSFNYDVFSSLHQWSTSVLEGIFPDSEDYQGLYLNPNDLLDVDVDIDLILTSNPGPMIYSAFAVFFGLLLIILGIIWVIQRICGTCCWFRKKAVNSMQDFVHNRFGGSRPPGDRGQGEPISRPKSKRTLGQLILGVTLFGLMVIYFAFLVALFVTNGQLKSSVGTVPKDMDLCLEDAENYIDLIQRQMDAVLKISYGNLSDEVQLIGQCGIMGGGRGTIQTLLSTLDGSIGAITVSLKPNSVLPPTLGSLITTTTILKNFQKSRNLCQNVEDLRIELEASANNLTEALKAIPIQETREDLGDIEEDLKVAQNAVFYSVLILNIVLLFVLVAISVGTILLVLRPKGKVGRISLNCGLFTIFLLGWLIWAFSIGLFFISGLLVTVLPGAFENIASNGSLVNPEARSSRDVYVVPSVPHILQTCNNSEAAYTVFKLNQVFDTSELDKLVELLVPDFQKRFLEDFTTNFEIDTTQLLELGVNKGIVNQLTETLSSLNAALELRLSDEEEMERQVNSYVDFAQDQIEHKIGECSPLWRVVDSTLYTFSYKLGSPIGTYWFALTFMLMLIFPIVLIAVIFLRQ